MVKTNRLRGKGRERTCACVVRAISSALAPYSSASTASAIISPAFGPIIIKTLQLPVFLSKKHLTRTDDMYPKYNVRLCLHEELNLALRV